MSRRQIFEDVRILVSRDSGLVGFRWRGRKYRVDAIERVWRVPPGRPDGRRIYRVRAGKRRFVLAQRLSDNRWALVRTPWRMHLSLALARLSAGILA
ncbi:MAG: hypothetical protein D6775_02550 [Caldilineae bacterium]|nr:MAG: hypothetical protein D6775_02550 [Caldilineae bacterium]